MSTRESLEFDVLIIGGGPAGLAAAIRLKQIAAAETRDINVCLIEKGAEIGAHTLAGAVLEPRALDELIPDWKNKNAPINTPVIKDEFCFLTAKKKIKLPTPPQMHNVGNYIVSLGRVVEWLGKQAEDAGVEVFAGFSGAEVLYDNGAVCGVATGDMGVQKDGTHGENYQPGVELRAPYTIFAEGCRGSLSQQVIKKFNLQKDSCPQTYALGIKELWEVPDAAPGHVLHTIGWPLSADVYGGSFLYHLAKDKIALGFVVGLDYQNPYLSPYQEFQRFKHHPAIAALLQNGKRIGYGARALNEGGWQSLPNMSMPGALLSGCAAGLLNVPKIKGAHTAMKSGMLAAEHIAAALSSGGQDLQGYDKAVRDSWAGEELRRARNIRPGFARGLYLGLANAAVDSYLLRGRAPWTYKNHDDHTRLQKAAKCKPIDYPKADGKLSFSRLDNLAYSGVNHAADQPPHLHLRDASTATDVNFKEYAGLEARYCPAGVYEFIDDAESSCGKKLVINAQNCVHCKTCDIKDPTQNIEWTVPEGGGGPNYKMM